MNNNKVKVAALLLCIGLPVVFFLLFRPLAKIPRPKTPQPLFQDSLVVSENEDGSNDTTAIYHRIPNFKFETQYGDTLVLDSLKGKMYIANFFFATCPGICPVLMNSMERVQSVFGKDEVLRLVSFSVDPERDNQAALRDYAKRHHAIPGKWFLCRSNREQTYWLAEKGFKLTAIADSPDDIEKIAHSEKFVLVDWQGQIRGYYSGTDSLRVNQLMKDAVMLLREYESGKGYRFDIGRKKKKE